MADKSAGESKFSVVLDNQMSGQADKAADSLEGLRSRIANSDAAIKSLVQAQNRLKGSSTEVTAARDELKAKINAERDAVTAATLKLTKLGTSYDKVTAQTKKLAAEQEDLAKNKVNAMSAAVTKAGGPVASLRDKLKSFSDIAGGEGAGASGLLTLGLAGLAAAAVAVTVALVAGAVSLAKWVIRAADTARSMNLVREAASGSAANALALGTQIDALAEKVPTSRAALNDMAVSLAKGGIQGKTLVDTLNAVGQAAAALGDEAGNKIKEFIDRGRISQRFFLNPQELQGTGIQFEDLAKSLATTMGVGVDKARAALRVGAVKLGDGAAAMRDAIEKKFGKINLRQMISLDNLAKKLGETFDKLTAGVNIEPLLEGFASLAKNFDTSTFSGAALKSIITAFGDAMTKTLTLAMPFIDQFLKGMIIAALDTGIAILKLRNWLTKTFGDSNLAKKIDWMNLAFTAGKVAVGGLVVAVVALAAILAVAVAPFALLYAGMVAVSDFSETLGKNLRKWFLDIDWSATGAAIVDGLVNGLKSGAGRLVDAVKGLAKSVKGAFTGALDIHSPSRVFAEYGENTTEGYAQGVERGTPAAARSLDDLTSTPPKSSAPGGAGARGGPVSVNVTINLNGAGGGDLASQLRDPSILAPLLKAIEDAINGGGIPGTA